MKRKELAEKLSRRLDLPMAILGLLLLGAVIAEIFMSHDNPARRSLELAGWIIWGLFAIEFVILFSLAENRREFLKHHWVEVLVVILPMFRVVRALRFLAGVEAYPLLEIVAFIGKGARALHAFFKQNQLGYLAGVTVLVTFLGAIAIHLFERAATGVQLRTFGDALWYSASLMTTIGAEVEPVTAGGRIIAFAMMSFAMIVAVYLIGTVSASLLASERKGKPVSLSPSTEEVEQVRGEKPDRETPAA